MVCKAPQLTNTQTKIYKLSVEEPFGITMRPANITTSHVEMKATMEAIRGDPGRAKTSRLGGLLHHRLRLD